MAKSKGRPQDISGMVRFVNENMTTAEQVDFVWTHRDLFERCRSHNLKVGMMRHHTAGGRYVCGFEVGAKEILESQGS